MGKTAKKVKEKRGKLLQKELETRNETIKAKEAIQKLKDEELFEITEPAKRKKGNKQALDPGRFKKKFKKYLGDSKTEERMVAKIAKGIKIEEEAAKKKPKEVDNSQLLDIWEPKPGEKVRKHKPKKANSIIPAVVIPHPGQSYNPRINDYNVNFLFTNNRIY